MAIRTSKTKINCIKAVAKNVLIMKDSFSTQPIRSTSKEKVDDVTHRQERFFLPEADRELSRRWPS